MCIHSMTGYASTSSSAAGWVVEVEARSVNHRGLDSRLNLPHGCASLEPETLGIIRQRMHRGRVEVRVEVSAAEAADPARSRCIDSARFEAVCQELRALSAQNGLLRASDELELSDVLVYRQSFEARDTADVEMIDPQNPALRGAIDAALAQLVEARRIEGAGIAADLVDHLAVLAEKLADLEALLPEELGAFRERLATRLRETLAEFGAGELDDERLAHELVYYADKADISEELQRAKSHLGRIQAILRPTTQPKSGEPGKEEPCGKTLDFYLQELIRETNTMGSKSSSARATDLVIAMKSTVERMREQVANIE